MDSELTAQLTLAAYVLIAIAVVLWRAVRHPQGWQRWLLYAIAAIYSRFCFGFRPNRIGPFLEAKPAIVIANHRSPLDPLFLWAGQINCRPIGFMTAREYCETPGLRFITHHMESIPVARDGKDMAATRAALRRLKEGKLLGIFPEGRINTGPGLLPGNPGVGWLALRSRAPVYPVFLHDVPASESMVEPFFKFSRVRMSYGDPIDLSAFYERSMTEDVLQEATNLMMSRLAELGGSCSVSQKW